MLNKCIQHARTHTHTNTHIYKRVFERNGHYHFEDFRSKFRTGQPESGYKIFPRLFPAMKVDNQGYK